jgi:hypothetical protein
MSPPSRADVPAGMPLQLRGRPHCRPEQEAAGREIDGGVVTFFPHRPD